MSICPVCPKCGAFAPFVLRESDVVESARHKYWPSETETIISSGGVIGCTNGHAFSKREMLDAISQREKEADKGY